MKHKHHIIPRHAGGTDDPSNLVELTVEEHALAHKMLYEQYGKEQDRIAWLALSKQSDKKDIIKASLRLGRKLADKAIEKKYGPNWRKIISDKGTLKGAKKFKKLYRENEEFRIQQQQNQEKARIAALSKESRLKRLETFKKIGHQQGTNNSNYGKIWIHSMEFRISKLIQKNEPIPEGWIKGRKMF